MAEHFSTIQVETGLQISIRPSRRGRLATDAIMVGLLALAVAQAASVGTPAAAAAFSAMGLLMLLFLIAGFRTEHLTIDANKCSARWQLGPLSWNRSVSVARLGCFGDLRLGESGYTLGSHLKNGGRFVVANHMGLPTSELEALAEQLNEYLAETRGESTPGRGARDSNT